MKPILIALISNILIAICKFFGYVITGSASMLSESIHSLGDCGNQLLLIIGKHRSEKQADFKFNFGHGKEEFIWSFLVAIILFSLGSIFSCVEGIKHIITPTKLENIFLVIGILFIGICLEGFSLYHALKETNNKNIFKYIKQSSNSSNLVVLIEDFAAITGLTFSFIFILMAYFINPIFDGVGALTTGIILGALSIILAIELANLIKGESLSQKETYQIKSMIIKEKLVENVNGIFSTIIAKEKYLIIVSVDPHNSDNGYDIEYISQKIKTIIKEKYPNATIFVDFSEKSNSYSECNKT